MRTSRLRLCRLLALGVLVGAASCRRSPGRTARGNVAGIPQAALAALRGASVEPLLPYIAASEELAQFHVAEDFYPRYEAQELATLSSTWHDMLRRSLEENVKEAVRQLEQVGLPAEAVRVDRVLVRKYGLGEYSPYGGPSDLTEGYGLTVCLRGLKGHAEITIATQIIGKRRAIASRHSTGKRAPDVRYLRLARATTVRELAALEDSTKRVVEDSWSPSFFADAKGLYHEQTHYLIVGKERVRHGPHRKWDAKGQLNVSGNYEKGRRTGQWLEHGGIQWQTGEYRQGRREGPWHGWHSRAMAKGDKAWECTYENGRIRGKKTYYNSPGWISVIEEHDSQGRRTRFTSFYQNGKKLREAHLKDGEQHGLDTRFDKEGNVVHRGEWRRGKPWNAWCFIPAAGDAGSFGCGTYVEFKDGKRVAP